MQSGHTNVSLLPHDSSVIIKDITQKIIYINLMKHLLEKFQQAIYFFEERAFYQFDAQVGETLCQIRAYKIFYLTAYFPQNFLKSLIETKAKLSMVICKLSEVAENYQCFLKMHKSQRPDTIRAPLTLIEFFASMDCLFFIPDDVIFIYLSNFLCHYHILDSENIPMAINYDAIAQDMELSRTYSKKLGHFYQKKLSELSCDFIFDLMQELPGNEDLKSILPLLCRQSDEGRMVLPCYSVTEIIVLHMIENNANLVFLVDIDTAHKKQIKTFFLKGSRSQNNFKLINRLNTINEPCMVMYGSSTANHGCVGESLLSDMLSTGFKEIILFNNAAHPQYSGTTLKTYSYDPFIALLEEREAQLLPLEKDRIKNLSCNLIKLKQRAEKHGCTANNRALFLLKHIFCNTCDSYHEFEEGDLMFPTNHNQAVYLCA